MVSTTPSPVEDIGSASPSDGPARALRVASIGGMLVGAVLVAGSAAVHLHLWLIGYRHIPTIGPLFLLQVITGFLLAGIVAGTRRVLPALGAVAFLASTIGGLVLSATVGIFGFHDGFNAPWALSSLVLEGAGVAVLSVAAALRWSASRR
jgi:hypothetical protein